MKLKIKEEYMGQVLSVSKIGGKNVRVADISEAEYLFYFKNGLAFIFEEVVTHLKEAKTQAESYIKEKEFEPKKRGKNVDTDK
jgi:hypothetical protein